MTTTLVTVVKNVTDEDLRMGDVTGDDLGMGVNGDVVLGDGDNSRF